MDRVGGARGAGSLASGQGRRSSPGASPDRNDRDEHRMGPIMYGLNIWLADDHRFMPRMAGHDADPSARPVGDAVPADINLRRIKKGILSLNIPSALSKGTAAPHFSPVRAPIRGEAANTHPDRLPDQVARNAATILVVDDEPRMRRLARLMLSELGYRVVEAENAAAAARLLERDSSVDLLFTDVVMPGEFDGRTLGHWARQARPGLAVLLTSGFIQHTAGADAPDTEPLPLLSKPFSKEQLQEAVQTLFRTRRS